MASDQAGDLDGGMARGPGSLPFDTSVAHLARMYDYLLGGKDNISQGVQGSLHSGLSVAIQRGSACFSNMPPVAVR